MLEENLISNGIGNNGLNIFMFNKYAIWVAKISHVLFFLLLSTRNTVYIPLSSLFVVFLLGFVFIVFFFFMSWLSTFKFLREILALDLIEDEDVKPHMLNELLPQLFFSVCNFLLLKLLHIAHLLVFLNSSPDYISIPTKSLIIYFVFFSIYTTYSILFNYENSIDVFAMGIAGVFTIWCYAFNIRLLFLPCLTSSAFYLIYRLKTFMNTKQYYVNEEKHFLNLSLYGNALMFGILILTFIRLVSIGIFSLVLTIVMALFMYADLNLQKLEKLYDTIENRKVQHYVSSFELNNKTPGTLD